MQTDNPAIRNPMSRHLIDLMILAGYVENNEAPLAERSKRLFASASRTAGGVDTPLPAFLLSAPGGAAEDSGPAYSAAPQGA
jgi:hypothetical protein